MTLKVALIQKSAVPNDPAKNMELGISYLEKAKELGHWIGTNGHTLIYGGGKIGLMGAVADAVLAEGGPVIGVIPEFLKTPDKSMTGSQSFIR